MNYNTVHRNNKSNNKAMFPFMLYVFTINDIDRYDKNAENLRSFIEKCCKELYYNYKNSIIVPDEFVQAFKELYNSKKDFCFTDADNLSIGICIDNRKANYGQVIEVVKRFGKEFDCQTIVNSHAFDTFWSAHDKYYINILKAYQNIKKRITSNEKYLTIGFNKQEQ